MNTLFLVQNLVPYHVARINSFSQDFTNDTFVLESHAREEFDILKVEEAHTNFKKLYLKKFSLQEFRKLIVANNISFIFCSGYSFRSSLFALCLGKGFQHVQVFACCESNYFDNRRNWIIERIKSMLVSSFSGFLVGSESHAEYIRRLYRSKLPLQIMLGYDVVDNNHFAPKKGNSSRQKNHNEIRFVAVSRFESKKNLLRLIQAFYRVVRDYNCFAVVDDVKPPLHLILVGAGRLESRIRNEIDKLGLANLVSLTGPVSYSDLPQLYQSCDILIHPSSTEQWGLVINEAMSAGLAVLCSKQTGAARVLVNRDNGIIFDAYSVDSIASAINRIATMPKDLINSMGSSSISKVNRLAPLSSFSRGALALISNNPSDKPLTPFIFKLAIEILGSL